MQKFILGSTLINSMSIINLKRGNIYYLRYNNVFTTSFLYISPKKSKPFDNLPCKYKNKMYPEINQKIEQTFV